MGLLRSFHQHTLCNALLGPISCDSPFIETREFRKGNLETWKSSSLLLAKAVTSLLPGRDPNIKTVLSIRIRIDFRRLDPDPPWECGSGTRRAKMTHRKKLRNYMF
jgi:hypothetical protein